jgi:hypothetical protein
MLTFLNARPILIAALNGYEKSEEPSEKVLVSHLKLTAALSPVLRHSADMPMMDAVCRIEPQ